MTIDSLCLFFFYQKIKYYCNCFFSTQNNETVSNFTLDFVLNFRFQVFFLCLSWMASFRTRHFTSNFGSIIFNWVYYYHTHT